MSKFTIQVAVQVTVEGDKASVEPLSCEVQERAPEPSPTQTAQIDDWKKPTRPRLEERVKELAAVMSSPPTGPAPVVNQEWPLDYQRVAERFVSWGILPGEVKALARTHAWPRLARCEAWILEKIAAEGVTRPDNLLRSLLRKKG